MVEDVLADPAPEGGGGSGSVDNALRMLSLFERTDSIRVAEVASELGIAKSTAHRILAMLEFHGFVRQTDARRAYVMGSALLESGLFAISGFDLRATARRHLEELRDETGESCGFLILDGADVVLIEFVATESSLRVVENVGDRQPAHLTAAGKAMLAEMEMADLLRLYPTEDLEAWTVSSLRTRSDLVHSLEEVRRRGLATNLEESGEGVVGVAAVVRGSRGHVAGALTVALPISRLGEDLESTLGPTIRRAAQRLALEIQ